MIIKKGNFWALLPLIIFILVYFSASIYLNDFYSVPALVVFMLALVIAFVQFPKVSFHTKAEAFCKNAGEETIMLGIHLRKAKSKAPWCVGPSSPTPILS